MPDITPEAERALEDALAVVEAQGDPKLRLSAERYAGAVDRLAKLRAHWAELGEPLLAEGGATGKATVPHPLVAMVANAERDAARLGSLLGLDPQSKKKLGARMGRPQEQVVPHADGAPVRARDRLRSVS